MTPDKHWPFARQADYDAFNANLKSDNHQWKEQAIRAWIEARSQVARQGKETLSTNGAQTSPPGIHQQKETKL